jgi:hypothetical protein
MLMRGLWTVATQNQSCLIVREREGNRSESARPRANVAAGVFLTSSGKYLIERFRGCGRRCGETLTLRLSVTGYNWWCLARIIRFQARFFCFGWRKMPLRRQRYSRYSNTWSAAHAGSLSSE